jgi:iron(III) transport system ATP-binding protein
MLMQIKNLSLNYGEQIVLNNLNLDANQGELTAVLGASGAGKSTLLRLIAGFESPTSGEIFIDSKLVSNSRDVVAPEKRGVGIVPQDSALFSHLTVSQNIGFGLPKGSDARIKELLNLVGLSDYADRKPASLSGGQAQRVALARALAPRPKLILLDEPFSALDAELRARLREDVRRVLRAENATAILVTHDQEEALSLADKVAILRDGKIIQSGSPTEIYNSPVDLGIATFLGDSILVDGHVEDGKIMTALGKITPLNTVSEEQVGVAAIRSENFYLQPNPSGDSEVIGRVFFGHDAVVEVQTPKLKIRARSNGPFAPEVGMKVTVWVRGAVNFYPQDQK